MLMNIKKMVFDIILVDESTEFPCVIFHTEKERQIACVYVYVCALD